MDPVFHPMKERRPWLCSKCKWHIFLGSKNCCPLCDEKLFDFAVPSKDLQYSQEKERKEVFEIQPSLWKVADVLNVGQIKQKRGQGLKPKQEGAIRFVCVSDTHSRQREIQNDIPDGDVFIHAGDITMCGEKDAFTDFNLFLASLPHKYKIIIAGNHDTTLQTDFYKDHFWRFHDEMEKEIGNENILTNCIYLQDDFIEIEGIKIYGTPWVIPYHDWAFNLDDEERKRKWDLIPEGIDILITHNPPKGQRSKSPTGLDLGDPFLLQRVQKIKPLVHVFGHVHSSYGKQKNFEILFLNVASLNSSYHPVNCPIVFDLIKK